MNGWKPNATANDWQRWKQAGGMHNLKITRVVVEGTCEGKVVKFDATQQYLDMLAICSPKDDHAEIEVDDASVVEPPHG
jgi:hypothetical protein